MNLFDTHCHLDFKAFDDDLPAVLDRAQAAGVQITLIPAVDWDSMKRARKLVDHYTHMYMAIGLHPNSTAHWQGHVDLEKLRELAKGAKVVSLGEIGLDYHWDKSPKNIQWRAFEDQLSLAKELELPVIIHNREASDDVVPILENWAKDMPAKLQGRIGVVHSFSASPAHAERLLAAGFYLGFTGPITYKNADELRRIATTTPLDRILIETDAPFLTPIPYRGQRNEPAYVARVAERIAALRQMSEEEIGEITTRNGRHLFGI